MAALDDNDEESSSPTKQLVNIEIPHHHDVLCGRGVTINKHPGNKSFRSLVSLSTDLYEKSTKRQKMYISHSIVEGIRTLEPPGRFLIKNPNTNLWSDIGDAKAIEKASQALRDEAAAFRKKQGEISHDPEEELMKTTSRSDDDKEPSGHTKPSSSSTDKSTKSSIDLPSTSLKAKEKSNIDLPSTSLKAKEKRQLGKAKKVVKKAHKVAKTKARNDISIQTKSSSKKIAPPEPPISPQPYNDINRTIEYTSIDGTHQFSDTAHADHNFPRSEHFYLYAKTRGNSNAPSNLYCDSSRMQSFYPNQNIPHGISQYTKHGSDHYFNSGYMEHTYQPNSQSYAYPLHPREQGIESSETQITSQSLWSTTNPRSHPLYASHPEYPERKEATDLWAPLPVETVEEGEHQETPKVYDRPFPYSDNESNSGVAAYSINKFEESSATVSFAQSANLSEGQQTHEESIKPQKFNYDCERSDEQKKRVKFSSYTFTEPGVHDALGKDQDEREGKNGHNRS